MESRNLEDFRLNDYLMPHLVLMTGGPDDGIEMSYTIYAIHAFYSTIEDIKDLEGQSTFVNNGKRSGISIALWFLAMESLINCLCKISCQKENRNFSDIKGKSIGGRLEYVFTVFGVDSLIHKQSGLISRVNEFLQFRNEIFHDRNTGEMLDFKKTNFSPLPFFSNQVDVFQSMLIFIEISFVLRYCIKELDLMANISIGNEHVLVFDKLDNLYSSFLRPFFEKALKKHNLQTQLNLDIDSFVQPVPNSNDYFKSEEVLPMFRREQHSTFKHDLNGVKTNMGNELYNSAVLAYDKPFGHNDSMNFIVNWAKLYQGK